MKFERLNFAPGSQIFREGDCGSFAYFIEHGHVEISALRFGHKTVITTLSDGEMFGEMALIDQRSRSATATAISDTQVITFSREQFQKIIDDAEPKLNMLLRVVVKRLRWAMNTALENEWEQSSEEYTDGEQTRAFRAASDQALQQVHLTRDLSDALTNEQFELFYQPILNIHDRTIAGFEGLIRWHHPTKGLVMPVDFVPAAEESGLIVPIGEWVLKQALQDLKRLQSLQKPDQTPLFMTVNVSAPQIESLASSNLIPDSLEAAGISPDCLKLEFTESVMISAPEVAAQAMQDIKKHGVSLAIDDFGTGYSSLSYLHRFPLDILKIDRSFVHLMTSDRSSLQVVRAIMGLSKGLGLRTVAEGIESHQSLKMLEELECDFIQGFLAAPPMPISTAAGWIRDGTELLATSPTVNTNTVPA